MRMPDRIRLPLTSRTFGPPRGRTTLQELDQSANIKWRQATLAYVPDWGQIKFVDGTPVPFGRSLPLAMPATSVVNIPMGRIADGSGWPIAPPDNLITDASFIHEELRFRAYRRIRRLDKLEFLDGRVLNLGSAFAGSNYGHAVLDGVGRLGVLDSAGFDVGDIDLVVLPGFASPTLRELVDRAGLGAVPTRQLTRGSHFECRQLIQTSFPGLPRLYNRLVPNFYRKLVDPSTSGRRLAVIRQGGRRAVSNYDQVVSLLKSFDFEIYDPMNSAFSPDDFAQASIVVGAHGAALTDLAFMSAGGRCIELLPDGHRYPYFASLSIAADLEYVAVNCISESPRDHSDFTVPLDDLKQAIRSIE